ncbi:fumarylacetoacetate hydrolase family protein [Candidatus Halobonum tyrrellensis]|uniref:Fumarylacetoacetate (FAA) hydrolase n=1 Tax=Candidatus Halobonum tyrrellensis G22 TaxID=1324957 RepID=V4J3N7_9EURY|nr:fumarylacetoacetate hydrolase family protein [Candidatus Halobonum tyrrellensis]ESP89997.1 fumarylacetoacetate (FAA) hydrolase [Candidatus Halobonum tyrrellensis G22]
MRYYQIGGEAGPRVVLRTADAVYDLTAVKPGVDSFGSLAAAASITDQSLDEVADRLAADAPTRSESDVETPETPIWAEEVWAAGVTYEISGEAREAESGRPDIYYDVYDGERPEVFFKATPSRLVGPGGAVGIRADSEWDVPEPELGVVLYEGDIVGYTVGNDVSSRSIEGENSLYLPQAKVYDRCCSIGPCVRSAASLDDPHDLEMSMRIERDGETMYDDATSTGEMVRSVEELVDCYTAHNAVPERAVLLTGTSLVPDDDFTLREGDDVRIEIEEVGVLSNTVTEV